jgi:hypothetical protein
METLLWDPSSFGLEVVRDLDSSEDTEVVGDGDGGDDRVEAVQTVARGDRGVTATSDGRLVSVVVMTPKSQVRVRSL